MDILYFAESYGDRADRIALARFTPQTDAGFVSAAIDLCCQSFKTESQTEIQNLLKGAASNDHPQFQVLFAFHGTTRDQNVLAPERLKGMVCFVEFEPGNFYFSNFCVDRDVRKRGIGSHLMYALKLYIAGSADFSKTGCVRLSGTNSASAKAFYQKAGMFFDPAKMFEMECGIRREGPVAPSHWYFTHAASAAYAFA